MTIGIYALYWAEPDLIYIGQSKNIEIRVYEHLRLLKANKHCNYKINSTYNIYGPPRVEILLTCSLEHLDSYEISLIKEFDSLSSGLNIIPGGIGTGKYTEHGASKFSKEELLNAIELLKDSNLSLINISIITGISEAVLSSLSNCSAHNWIFDNDKDLIDKLTIARHARKLNARVKSANYGKSLISTTGEEHIVYNISEFSKLHNLTNTKVCEVLNKKRLSHKGWKLKES